MSRARRPGLGVRLDCLGIALDLAEGRQIFVQEGKSTDRRHQVARGAEQSQGCAGSSGEVRGIEGDEGGITGALHFDAVAMRNIVGVNCSFRYAAPSNPASPLDAARVRRTDGLVAFFGCDASQGAKDGWSFHEDGVAGLHVLLQDCTGYRNGAGTATSCNAVTTHDSARAIVLNGDFGLSRNGTEVHCVQSTHTWAAGARAVARDVDGTSVAFKCSNPSFMWLQDCVADADGSVENYALEANAGTVFTRDFTVVNGSVVTSLGGSVTPF